MRTKFYLLSAVLILALVLSACQATPKAAADQDQTTNTPPRTMNVTGTSQVALSPDIAYISIGVHTENADATQAVSSNTAQTQKIVNSLKALGIDAKDIQTTNFSIYPQKQYTPEGKETGTTIYMVDNTVYVTLRDLPKIGQIISAAVSAGANNINGIQFDVADKTDALQQGRKAAVEDAKKQADDLASAAGVTLGPIQTINFYNPNPMPVPVYEKAVSGVGGGGASVPVSPGQMTITVQVNVIYEIK